MDMRASRGASRGTNIDMRETNVFLQLFERNSVVLVRPKTPIQKVKQTAVWLSAT